MLAVKQAMSTVSKVRSVAWSTRLEARAHAAEASRHEKELACERTEMAAERARLEAERSGEVSRLEKQIQALQREAIRQESELRETRGEHLALQDTLGVRLQSRYWRVLQAFAPIASPQRRLYMRLRDFRAPVRGARTPTVSHVEMRESQLDDLRGFVDGRLSNGNRRWVMIVAPTIFDRNQGQRSYNLAIEMAKRGIPVVFCYWRWDLAQVLPQDHLSIGIFQLPLDWLLNSSERVLGMLPEGDRTLLVEFPYPGMFRTLGVAHAMGWIVAYDFVDDWAAFSGVGQAAWYDESFEAHLSSASDLVTAVHPELVRRARQLGRQTVSLVPNGCSPALWEKGGSIQLDRGTLTIGYFGHLSEAWFDWALLLGAASARPDWIFYLIGQGAGWRVQRLPENVRYLGQVPQEDLASYAANWDVGIVPFKPGAVASGADPIKTYEYLSMGLPVVVTGVTPPLGAELIVTRAEGTAGFCQAVVAVCKDAKADSSGRDIRRAFASLSTWSLRADSLLALLDGQAQRIAEKREVFPQGHAGSLPL